MKKIILLSLISASAIKSEKDAAMVLSLASLSAGVITAIVCRSNLSYATLALSSGTILSNALMIRSVVKNNSKQEDRKRHERLRSMSEWYSNKNRPGNDGNYGNSWEGNY